MTPPFVVGVCSYWWEDVGQARGEFAELLSFCLVGLFLWALACFIMWFGVLIPKFRQITRREELIYE